MARPRKCRRVCALPEQDTFGPLGTSVQHHEPIPMTVDEFETIRLIDHEGMTQEACADQMGVARTTVQAMYAEARRALAHALVEGRPLAISGGDYELCDDDTVGRRPHCCRRRAAACTGRREDRKTDEKNGVSHD